MQSTTETLLVTVVKRGPYSLIVTPRIDRRGFVLAVTGPDGIKSARRRRPFETRHHALKTGLRILQTSAGDLS